MFSHRRFPPPPPPRSRTLLGYIIRNEKEGVCPATLHFARILSPIPSCHESIAENDLILARTVALTADRLTFRSTTFQLTDGLMVNALEQFSFFRETKHIRIVE